MRFAVIGDYGLDSVPEADVARLVQGWEPDLVLTTGDNNYDYGEASTIDRNIGQYYCDFIYPYYGRTTAPTKSRSIVFIPRWAITTG